MNTTANLEDLARSVIRRQRWARLLLLLACCLGTATGLLVTFFKNDSWRQWLLTWAWEHECSEVIAHVVEGSYAGITWQEWAAIGAGTTAVLLAIWVLMGRNIARKMNSIPGLREAVQAEREQQHEVVLGLLVLLLLAVFLIPLLIAIGMSARDHHCSHCDDWDDWDD